MVFKTQEILQLTTGGTNENILGPDGEEFVIALQRFMSSFLRSQRGPVGGIEVEVEGAH